MADLAAGREQAGALQLLGDLRGAIARNEPRRVPEIWQTAPARSLPRAREGLSAALEAAGIPLDPGDEEASPQSPEGALRVLPVETQIAVIDRAREALTGGPEPFLYRSEMERTRE